MVTNCCKTTLLVDNVNYHSSKDLDDELGAEVLLFPAVIMLATEMIPSGTTVNFETDYPAEKAAVLKSRLAVRPKRSPLVGDFYAACSCQLYLR